MNRLILVFFVFSSLYLFSQEEVLHLDSCHANYDGKEIILSGEVVVDSEIGKINADHIVLKPESEEKYDHFVYLKMNGNVKMQLKDGGQLLCSSADLDYLQSIGQFTGNLDHDYVVYTESCKVKEDKRMPLVLKAREMSVILDSEKKCINEITAHQNVTVNYNHDFVAASDHAVYKRFSSSSKMDGQIELYEACQNGLCQLTNRNADLIRASKIQVDTLKRDLHFTCPKGSLYIINQANKKEKLYFQSDVMTWNDHLNLLTLKGDIVIHQQNIIELQGNEEVKIFYFQEDGKKKIKQIESLGETMIAHVDEDKKLVHTLTSYGKTTVDQVRFQTVIESPRLNNGQVVNGKQIYFHDTLGEIYADVATLDYAQINGSIRPEKLTLAGNVQILNRSTVNPEESEAFLQYALADKVQFFPASHEMLMSATNGEKVLFYDKANQLQISAPAVKITRDGQTKKESIQGIGDVSFSLLNHELEKLKSHFSLEPKDIL